MDDDRDDKVLKFLLDLIDSDLPTNYESYSEASMAYSNSNSCNSLDDQYSPSFPPPRETEPVQIEEIWLSDTDDDDLDANKQKQTECYPDKTLRTCEGDGLKLASMQDDKSEEHMVSDGSLKEIGSNKENIILKDFDIRGLFKLETLVQICQSQNLKFIHFTNSSMQDDKSEKHIVSNGSLNEVGTDKENTILKDSNINGLSKLETSGQIPQSQNLKFTHFTNASMQDDKSKKCMLSNGSHKENIILKDFDIKALSNLETLRQISQSQNLKFTHFKNTSMQDDKSEKHMLCNRSHKENIILKDFDIEGLPKLDTLGQIPQSQNLKFTHFMNSSMHDDNSEKHMVSNGSHKENIILKDFEIRGLSKLETLVQTCQSQRLKFIHFTNSLSRPIYDIDMVLEHQVIHGETYYHIKWKNLSTEHNSWEHSSHLKKFIEIQYYHALQNSQTVLDATLIAHFITELFSQEPTDILTLTKVLAATYGKSERAMTQLNLTVEELKNILSATPIETFIYLKDMLKFMQFGEARKRTLINLSEWQDKINSKHKSECIKVENNVDLETAPSNFVFIHDYVNTVINIPEEPVIFCECQDCYSEKKTCCPHNSDACFAYDRFHHLILEPGYPIFECNSKCSCDSNCINRVVQHGQKVKVCIFRTSNNCGWGLKTLEDIEKGQFVTEYFGEIITSDEADARGRVYDYDRQSYLFDLDYQVNNAPSSFTIDAGHFGNVSHFINHSCDPNLHVFAVFINQLDPRLPRIAFFAKKKIHAGEELTFDYKMVVKGAKKSRIAQKGRVLCKCKSKKCRKYLF